MIDLEIAEGVAFLTINAPATRNALSNELAAQFVAVGDEADRDPSVGAAVISGAGGFRNSQSSPAQPIQPKPIEPGQSRPTNPDHCPRHNDPGQFRQA